MNSSPKCFGTTQYVHKEEYERERQRLQQKLDEAEAKIIEATVVNSEMMQIKAELNKKIVEFEKNQRPLIEQNKRLSDRNRIIQQELKKLEENLCHSQDDFLTLKDAYERLNKENAALKELRAFPEKLKELDRYRSQVLEYSKCINALRQSGLEKDRRYELLVQKFKRMKKCLARKMDDDDRQSSYGSEGSAESSINLDTITEDIDEALDIDPASFGYETDIASKLSAFSFGEEQILKEQLELANSTINELQMALASQTSMSDFQNRLNLTISQQEKKIHDLQSECSALKLKLMNSEENNDLLEFQILELRENSNSDLVVPTEHKSIETDEFVDEDLESVFDDIKTFTQMDAETIIKTKEQLKKLRRIARLMPNERDSLKKGLQYIENLENKLAFAETELNMTNCELKRVEGSKSDEISELKRQIKDFETNSSRKKRELQSELDSSKKELEKCFKTLKENEKCKEGLEAKIIQQESALNDFKLKKENDDKLIEEMQQKLANVQAEKIEQLKTLQIQFEEQIKINESVNTELSKVKEEFSDLIDEKENLHNQMAILSRSTKEKGEEFENEVRKVQNQIEEIKKSYEKQLEESKETKKRLEKDFQEVSNECEKLKLELKNTCVALQDTQNEWASKVACATKEAAAAVDHCRIQAEKREAELLEAKNSLEKVLQETRMELENAKSQIRPIGTQLERRYEENRYRLQEANRKNQEMEEQLENAKIKIEQLENANVKDYVDEITQLKAYNKQLEDQFNEQMEIIAALKNKFIVVNNNTDDGMYSKRVAQPTSSIEDEQYHSESSSVASFNPLRNKA
uniref:Uncharacterized protein n=1 Tax=Panagrolaimus sp. JU765 TaxID=591449 RepID=A0AC34PV11_9BILA